MSHDATNWAIKQRGLKPAAKLVLWHLCDRYHPDNGCFPAQETLANDCEMSRSSLNDQLDALEKAGLIRREKRFNEASKRQLSTRYMLGFEAGFVPCGDNQNGIEGDENRVRNSDTGANSVSENGQKPCPNFGESRVRNSDTNPVREPVREPVSEREREREDGQEVSLQPERGESKETIERAFWAFVKDWPGFAGMPKEAALRAWLKASAEDRKLAAERRDGWFALLKRQGKSHVPAPSTYLNERLFADVEPASQTARAVEPPFGPAWCAERIERLRAVRLQPVMFTAFERSGIASGMLDEAGLRARKELNQRAQALGFMDGQASEGKGAAVSETARAAGKGFVPVSRGSAAWVAWQARFAALGWPWLPDMGRHQVAYFPADIEAFEAQRKEVA